MEMIMILATTIAIGGIDTNMSVEVPRGKVDLQEEVSCKNDADYYAFRASQRGLRTVASCVKVDEHGNKTVFYTVSSADIGK